MPGSPRIPSLAGAWTVLQQPKKSCGSRTNQDEVKETKMWFSIKNFHAAKTNTRVLTNFDKIYRPPPWSTILKDLVIFA